MKGKPEDLHTVMNFTAEGDIHFTQHKPDDCPVHGNGKAKGRSHHGSTAAFRLGWDEWQSRSRKANLN